MGTTSSETGRDPSADPHASAAPHVADPLEAIPLEVARATLLHWWREPIAGLLSIGIGVWDTWHYGRDDGLSSSIDELLVIGGIVLIAGSRRLFMGTNGNANGHNGVIERSATERERNEHGKRSDMGAEASAVESGSTRTRQGSRN